jgi:mono/diheme cytochrome c family protein
MWHEQDSNLASAEAPGSSVWGQPPSAVRPSAVRCSLPLPLLLFACAAMALPLAALGQKPTAAKPTADLPPGAMQAKATTSCLECHEARIILQQRLSIAAWTKEVDKTVKWGAVVDASDRDALIDYLSTNFSPDKPQYEPPRSASAMAGATKSMH